MFADDQPQDRPADQADIGGTLEFRRLEAADLPVLGRWLSEPLTARWWNHDASPEAVAEDFGPSVRGEEPGEDLIVLLDGCPVGLVQRSVIADYPEDFEEFSALVEVPDGSVELDYLIGEPELRGRGLGARMIRVAVEDTWSALPSTSAVFVAVNAANGRSWGAVQRAGLLRVGEGDMHPDNPIDSPLHYVYRCDRPVR